MNNEIKEILSLLNSSSWSNEAKQIEDYITNLQEENKKLKLENKVLKEQMVAMVQPNYVYGFTLQGEDNGKDN